MRFQKTTKKTTKTIAHPSSTCCKHSRPLLTCLVQFLSDFNLYLSLQVCIFSCSALHKLKTAGIIKLSLPGSYRISLVNIFLTSMLAQRRTPLIYEYFLLRYIDRMYWKSRHRIVHLVEAGAGPLWSETRVL